MAQESFQDPQTAQLMNELFINIKVDREEHPAIDDKYMAYLIAATGNGGWPISAFCTPAGQPFLISNYYPKTSRHGKPAFQTVLKNAALAWQQQKERLNDQVTQLQTRVENTIAALNQAGGIEQQDLNQALQQLQNSWLGTKYSDGPQFPLNLELATFSPSTRSAKTMLKAMLNGNLRDHKNGGIFRYCTSENWLRPHFEKMLYDNALFLNALARQHSGDTLANSDLSVVLGETVQFLKENFKAPNTPLLFASLNANTAGIEGGSYLYSQGELENMGIHSGIVEEEFTALEIGAELRYLPRNTLRAQTKTRLAASELPRPEADEKLITGWNALTATALTNASLSLGEPQWFEWAQHICTQLITSHIGENGEVARFSIKTQVAKTSGHLQDYAYLSTALLNIYALDANPHWLETAHQIAAYAVKHLTQWRGIDPSDNGLPGAKAAFAQNLYRLSLLTKNTTQASQYDQLATELLAEHKQLIKHAPRLALGGIGSGLEILATPVQMVAVIPQNRTNSNSTVAEVVLKTPELRTIFANQSGGLRAYAVSQKQTKNHPLVAHHIPRPEITVYICSNQSCSLPITDLSKLRTIESLKP